MERVGGAEDAALERVRRLGEDDPDLRDSYEGVCEGDSNSMFNLGLHFARTGKLDDAVLWYSRAAEHGDYDAVANLGLILRDLERLDEAERWLRIGAEAGHAMCANNLGNILTGWQRFDEALEWARRAVELGSRPAATNLERLRLLAKYHVPGTDPETEYAQGMVLVERGDVDAALPRLGAAAASAHRDAVFEFASLLSAKGELAESSAWYRIAVLLGNTRAMVRLVTVSLKLGDRAAAREWAQRAVAAGQTVAGPLLSAIDEG